MYFIIHYVHCLRLFTLFTIRMLFILFLTSMSDISLHSICLVPAAFYNVDIKLDSLRQLENFWKTHENCKTLQQDSCAVHQDDRLEEAQISPRYIPFHFL